MGTPRPPLRPPCSKLQTPKSFISGGDSDGNCIPGSLFYSYPFFVINRKTHAFRPCFR
jgi:hypothetical protein